MLRSFIGIQKYALTKKVKFIQHLAPVNDYKACEEAEWTQPIMREIINNNLILIL